MAENHVLIPGAAMYTQADSKETDLSKNLVGGECRGLMMAKNARRRSLVVVLALCLAALAAWLTTLTLVREVQIARLQRELNQLSANLVAVTATVKSLNQKLVEKNYEGGMTFEDTIYTDEDVQATADKGHSSVEKLHDLTVLEDEHNIVDDEDDEYYDGESGDFYRDYDKKVGTNHMVHLKPEDFTDTMITFEKEKQGLSNIREIKRLLNENPESLNMGYHPAAEAISEKPRSKRSFLPPATLLDSYPPRTEAKEERRKTKKYSAPSEIPVTSSSLPTMMSLSRTVRSDEEGASSKPFIAAHFHGNTSHLSPIVHDHYKGNGLVRLAHGAAHDVWYPSPWTVASPHPRPTLTRNGHVHVHHTGVYLVYVQIYYLDTHDIISWVLHRTNPNIEGRDTLLQCAQSSHSLEVLEKPNSCYSSAALFLKAGDKLAVRNTGGDRHSLMEPEKSFIGLIKLADAEDPNDDEL